MVKKKTIFICQQCGYQSPKWLGKCPSCNNWNSMIEELKPTKGAYPPNLGFGSMPKA